MNAAGQAPGQTCVKRTAPIEPACELVSKRVRSHALCKRVDGLTVKYNLVEKGKKKDPSKKTEKQDPEEER